VKERSIFVFSYKIYFHLEKIKYNFIFYLLYIKNSKDKRSKCEKSPDSSLVKLQSKRSQKKRKPEKSLDNTLNNTIELDNKSLVKPQSKRNQKKRKPEKFIDNTLNNTIELDKKENVPNTSKQLYSTPQVFHNPILYRTKNEVDVTKNDIESLKVPQWLTDTIIFAFFKSFTDETFLHVMETSQITHILENGRLFFEPRRQVRTVIFSFFKSQLVFFNYF